jgi:hypothetical protein
MTELAAKKAASASAISVIATTLLALIAANKYSADPEHPAVSSSSRSAAQPKADATRPPQSNKPVAYDESLALRPLCDAVFGEGSGKGKESLQALRTESKHDRPMALRCLLAAVPDPSASLGFRFDETIDSIEEAARVYGYVLERWRLPWSEQPLRATPEVPSEKKSQPRSGDDPPSKRAF